MALSIQLTQEQKKLSQALRQWLANQIEQNGPMTFCDYMNHALYHPRYGYYRNGSAKFGGQGDFITAPLISPLFSQCLARQFIALQGMMTSPAILECGAGNGQMALSILEYLDAHDALPLRYCILELSGQLQAVQQETIFSAHPRWKDRVVWLDAWPINFKGLVLANELFDAMPVHLFRSSKDRFESACVDYQQDRLSWFWRSAPVELQQSLNNLSINFSNNYQSEYNSYVMPWFHSLSNCLDQGAFIAIDYGFVRSVMYHPDRQRGTLMCHIHHQAHDDPLLYPGIQDITAHVDFTLLADSAERFGLDCQGLVSQAHGLLNAGIMDLLSSDDDLLWREKQALQRLMHPGEMGELFQWIGFSRGLDDQLPCFLNFDQSHRL